MTGRWLFAVAALGVATLAASAGDWPQWRGPNRDGKATGFKAPATWPKDLTKKWRVGVGDGVATPALVGDKLFVFSRQGGDEVTRCLDAATGKEVWIDKYAAAFSGRGDKDYPGPRSSPAVADGKVVTFGVNGTLSCLDAASGKKVWRVETKGMPTFHTSCSPLVVDKVVITQFGSEKAGGVAAYDLADGSEKWKWTDEGTGYASPVLMTLDGTKMLVAETNDSVVGLNLKDGKLLWKTPFAVPMGIGNYNASTPMIDGQTVLFSGSGRSTKAVKVEKSGDTFAAKELWSNKDSAVIYNTPVVRGKVVFGLTGRDSLFAVETESGKTAWTAPVKGGGGRIRGYGSVVDAGTVLVSLTPAGELVVFEPSDKEFKQVASYPVADGWTYAYPVLDGNRVFIKDKDAVTLWTVE